MYNSQYSSLVSVYFLPQVQRPARPLIVRPTKAISREVVRADDGWSAYVDGQFVGFRSDLQPALDLANSKRFSA